MGHLLHCQLFIMSYDMPWVNGQHVDCSINTNGLDQMVLWCCWLAHRSSIRPVKRLKVLPKHCFWHDADPARNAVIHKYSDAVSLPVLRPSSL